jgi:8-oxo-dGTP pyrophosphatase MutT (NUDIX family)
VRRDEVETALAGFDRIALDRPDLRRAAVAITLVEDAAGRGATAFLITRRTPSLRAHAGQWALPGGRVEPGETAESAARRELCEEVGLVLDESAVVGVLDDYPTRSGFLITPVVAWAGVTGELSPQAAEVEHIYAAPLRDLDVEPSFLAIPESDQPVIRLPLFDRFVHAPTAAVLYQFREVVMHGRATRVAHLEQPVFAWR